MARRMLLLLMAVALVAGCNGCATTSAPAPPLGGVTAADATVAVNARSAIDSAEALHVAACQWAVTEHVAGRLADDRYATLRTACDAVAAAEELANAQLAVYLATGSLDAQKALGDALVAVTREWAALDAARKQPEVH